MSDLEKFKDMISKAQGEKEEPEAFADGTVGIRCYTYGRADFVTFYFDKATGELKEIA